MSTRDLPDDEKRLVELATGFALGELDSPELQELYDRLRGSSEEAGRAAGVVWETLGTSVDLRAVLGRHFQDTVKHRISDEDGGSAGSGDGDSKAPAGARSRGFLSALAARIGIARPSLDPVELPDAPRALPRRRRRMIVALLLSAVLMALCAVAFCRRRGAVRAAAVSGVVTVEGAAVTAGKTLPRSPTIVSDGASLLLAWSDGHEALIRGPANVVPHESGLSLSSGTAWVRAAGRFTLGLPDGQAHCAVPAAFVAHIRENRTLLGASKGAVKITVRFQHATLQAGNAQVLGESPFVWRKSLPWKDSASPGRPGWTVRHIECEEPPPCWRIAFTAGWSAQQEELVFSLPSGDTKAESRLVIRPGSVELTPAGRPRRSWRLTGAPLLPRAVQIISPHAGRPVLMMDGLDDPIPLPSSALPTAIEFSKAAAPRDFSVGSGPPPRPREGMGAPL